MRKESSMLWQQALHDLDTAEKLIEIQKYYASVFFSEQAAEKALKCLNIEKKRKIERSHDLLELAKKLGAPPEVTKAAAQLSPDYVITRYPDAANAVPAELYDAESARTHYEYGQRVITWVQQELRLKT